ncbi:hypothetical protein N0V93_003809 [Gnomoniopsis smithogilvyi]|uniref:DH domain-containing protein n=1 Tax=Gnomoniopsis smithogilvyi TaxID=1191159 RepID=A0A9W8YXB9_9PEZI|nr:hypothetical protein N0V93_003809 [Gnomoniopsis smithogilvyi]
MDEGNREEEDLRSSWDPGAGASASPSSTSHHDSHHLVPTQLSPARQHYPYPSNLDSVHSTSNDRTFQYGYDPSFGLSTAAFAADNNIHAVNSNATIGSPDRRSPDDFYRGYQHHESDPHDLADSPVLDPMASVVSPNRQAPPSKSTGNATSSKPQSGLASRLHTRPPYRSASNPVDDRFTNTEAARVRAATGSAAPAAARATVKDMKKKFEQNAGQSAAEARRVASRTAARDATGRPVNGRSATIGHPQSYSSLRATGTDPSRSSPATAQRSKFVPEDQISTNAQSFASRINRPKPPVAPKPQNTKPSASLNKQASFPPSASDGPLLFGEIRQEQLDAETPGHGIDDGSITGQDPAPTHQRSQSDARTEPGSPTDWYRSAPSHQKSGAHSTKSSPAKPHHRSQIALSTLFWILAITRLVEESGNSFKLGESSVNTFKLTSRNATNATWRENLKTTKRRTNSTIEDTCPPCENPQQLRRKLSLGGPVDFAQRRETIKLKYSKSIRETEAKQAREAAAERRKKELEAAAKAKARAQARAEAQVAAAQAAAAAQLREPADSPIASNDVDAPGETNVEPTNDSAQTSDAQVTNSPDRAKPPKLTLDSPTLGLPGTFPSFGSPPLDRDQAPPSAISETSAVTEFDNEAQTEPPLPELSTHAVAPEQPPEPDNARDALSAPQLTLAYEKRATYRDPFEDITDDEGIPIQIALETSSPRTVPTDTSAWVTAQADPPVPGAFTEEHDTVSVSECESQHQSEYQPEIQSEPQASDIEIKQTVAPEAEPQKEVKDEYEPPAFVPQPYHSTTVTIISRDAGFGPPTFAEQERANSTQPSNEPQMDSLEDFYTGPRLKDNVASLRDSTFTMSDAETSDGRSGSGEAQRTPDTSNSLNVPSLTAPANRLSQHSMWTDLSYSSRDSRRLDYRSDVDGSRPQSLVDDDSSFRHRFFVDGSGHVQNGDFYQGNAGHHRVTETDMRSGFFGPYGTGADRAPHPPKLPDHSPPPPPEDESRPPSGYYDDHGPHSAVTKDDLGSVSFPVSRRESDDYSHIESSHDSLGSGTPAQTPIDNSLEEERKLSEDASGETGPAKKEKSRLRQRELCIKELVDTEAVFVRDMNVVEEIYKGTAEACPKLDDKDIKLIFRNTHEIIAFHTTFLSEIKDGVSSVYVPRGRRSPLLKEDKSTSDATTINSMVSTTASTVPSTAPSLTVAASLLGNTATNGDTDDAKDRQTIIGPAFIKNIEQMRIAHEGFLRTSDVASKRLIEIQQDPTVQVWLNECNEVARDLTAAWNLDSLLIKPMQRITKYPNLILQLLQYTPEDHPDREGLMSARVAVENAILEINKTKKNFELVGQIVGRKRKESDVKAGFARAFGKRVDKLQASSNRPPEDPEYLKLNEKFSDDYLRLQVVLRDVEFYTRQVSAYVQTFLDYLSAMELVMRLQPGPHPELEAKWVQFNVSMRDIKTVALDQHLFAIRKHVIEPFELVIRSYQNPLLAMKKRGKRRLDYEKSVQVKKSGKKMDKQLTELVEHYEALNETLIKELPQLSALTEKVGNICLGNMINIQAKWWFIWREKIRAVAATTDVPEITEIVTNFQRDFKEMEEQVISLGILNQTLKPRGSLSTIDDSVSTMSRMDSTISNMSRLRSRPSDLGTPRLRASSITSDQAPVLPAPDFGKTPGVAMSPTPAHSGANSAGYFYRDYYAGISSRGPASPASSDFSTAARSVAPILTARPGTGRSFDSQGMLSRPSIDSASMTHPRRESNATTSPPPSGHDGQRNSGLFQSALPLTETPEEPQRGRSSRGSSRERHITKGYNVLWLAASLFEFNIETTKHEAGYPYLTYTAGEIFDVIAEKGELWLAKNQDDPNDLVGWIWSKHFAKLADS